ncbi:hypothetical protein EIN_061150 [Entamoeba invadens IP1]|uniref:hypothetical protein n=1 Tax=Entamoeba invadens IP1 TaxID=370355 RepID=UPI0002C3ECF5|nr:hypothetical protein EIN_061150 [Entamoeba invadens IP1]ELP93550.1 hypothetical protein EIN_061150 [Entamoeba invadens IP1]|eukprot:XP_004260321.1 hypothetical protein EIN_061150 [Entamoeba invadens IP1]
MDKTQKDFNVTIFTAYLKTLSLSLRSTIVNQKTQSQELIMSYSIQLKGSHKQQKDTCKKMLKELKVTLESREKELKNISELLLLLENTSKDLKEFLNNELNTYNSLAKKGNQAIDTFVANAFCQSDSPKCIGDLIQFEKKHKEFKDDWEKCKITLLNESYFLSKKKEEDDGKIKAPLSRKLERTKVYLTPEDSPRIRQSCYDGVTSDIGEVSNYPNSLKKSQVFYNQNDNGLKTHIKTISLAQPSTKDKKTRHLTEQVKMFEKLALPKGETPLSERLRYEQNESKTGSEYSSVSPRKEQEEENSLMKLQSSQNKKFSLSDSSIVSALMKDPMMEAILENEPKLLEWSKCTKSSIILDTKFCDLLSTSFEERVSNLSFLYFLVIDNNNILGAFVKPPLDADHRVVNDTKHFVFWLPEGKTPMKIEPKPNRWKNVFTLNSSDSSELYVVGENCYTVGQPGGKVTFNTFWTDYEGIDKKCFSSIKKGIKMVDRVIVIQCY